MMKHRIVHATTFLTIMAAMCGCSGYGDVNVKGVDMAKEQAWRTVNENMHALDADWPIDKPLPVSDSSASPPPFFEGCSRKGPSSHPVGPPWAIHVSSYKSDPTPAQRAQMEKGFASLLSRGYEEDEDLRPTADPEDRYVENKDGFRIGVMVKRSADSVEFILSSLSPCIRFPGDDQP